MSKRNIPIHDGDAPVPVQPEAPAPATVESSALIDVGTADSPAVPDGATPAEVEVETQAVPEGDVEVPAASEAPAEPAEPAVDPVLRALLAENERMRKALDEKDGMLQRYIAAHKKSEAEFAKVRARLEADLDRRVEAARADLIRKLFPVVDDLERSLESAKKTPTVEALQQGVDMVHKAFLARLGELGVVRYEPQGQPFDPGLHEAMGVLPAPTAEQNNTVLHVYQPGYRAGDNVLRPARVIVGKFGG